MSTTFPISRLLNMSVDLLTMLLSYIIFFSFYSEPLFIPEIYEVRLSCQIFNSFGLAYVFKQNALSPGYFNRAYEKHILQYSSLPLPDMPIENFLLINM